MEQAPVGALYMRSIYAAACACAYVRAAIVVEADGERANTGAVSPRERT